eukprot:365403-Chlamydomonas_euryale.AAC.9
MDGLAWIELVGMNTLPDGGCCALPNGHCQPVQCEMRPSPWVLCLCAKVCTCAAAVPMNPAALKGVAAYAIACMRSSSQRRTSWSALGLCTPRQR